MLEMTRHIKKYPNKSVIMLFWMSLIMTELPNKIENKDNKYDIMN